MVFVFILYWFGKIIFGGPGNKKETQYSGVNGRYMDLIEKEE